MAANPNPVPDPNQKLVRVFDTERQLIEEYRRAPGEELSEDFSDTGEGGAQ